MSPDIDERLARLAPTTPPDPERFAAARAAVVHATSAHRTDDGDPGRLLDPDDDRVRVDVAVPLDAARRAARTRRGVTLAAAAAGVVGVAAAALFLGAPAPGPGPASSGSACGDRALGLSGMDRLAEPPRWRTLAASTSGGSELTILVLENGSYGVACTSVRGDGATRGTTTSWPGTPGGMNPGADEVVVGGTLDGRRTGWHALWGRAGTDVRDLRVTLEWTGSPSGHEGGSLVEATVSDDGYWWAAYPESDLAATEEELYPESERSWILHWTAPDGSTRTMDLGEAWEGHTGVGSPRSSARKRAGSLLEHGAVLGAYRPLTTASGAAE